jgi:hypothetical protein
MSTATYNVRGGTSASSTPTEAVLHAHSAVGNDPRPAVVVPESQLYYWTGAWQRNERRAVEELARGEGRRFETPADAIRWLLSSED